MNESVADFLLVSMVFKKYHLEYPHCLIIIITITGADPGLILGCCKILQKKLT